MQFSKLVFTLTVGFAINSLAGTTGSTKGNGGFVVTCTTMTGVTYNALDLFEAEKNRNLKLLKFEEKSSIAIALQVVDQLEKLSPQRANTYRKRIQSFKHDSQFVSNAVFTDVHDAYPVYLPNNCHLAPVAIQTRYALDEDHSFYINKDLWERLSPIDQAAIIVHEVVFMEFSHELSVLTRAFVGLLFSDNFRIFYQNPQKFLDLLVKVKAPYYEQNTIMIDLRSPFEVYPNSGVIKKGRVNPGSYSAGEINVEYVASEVSFYRNGIPMFLTLNEQFKSYVPIPCLGATLIKSVYDEKVHFYKNGKLWKANFIGHNDDFINNCDDLVFKVDPQDAKEYVFENERAGFYGKLELSPEGRLMMTEGLQVTFKNRDIPVTLGGKVFYWSDHRPKSGTLAEAVTLTTPMGSFKAKENKAISFTENGALLCGTSVNDLTLEDENRIVRVHADQEICFK